MKSTSNIAFLELDPAQGIQIGWLKCKYNHCVVKLSQLTTEIQERQQLLDTCARIFQHIQELEFEQRLRQAASSQSTPSATD